ncbi:hypothetical protein Sjap_020530 [Stephania japonica]|uniref:Uncharacterized protein n=1 Tax=Stephania japonica TaxID=461633 RepID=A0AAP0I0D1_9MAGN
MAQTFDSEAVLFSRGKHANKNSPKNSKVGPKSGKTADDSQNQTLRSATDVEKLGISRKIVE